MVKDAYSQTSDVESPTLPTASFDSFFNGSGKAHSYSKMSRRMTESIQSMHRKTNEEGHVQTVWVYVFSIHVQRRLLIISFLLFLCANSLLFFGNHIRRQPWAISSQVEVFTRHRHLQMTNLFRRNNHEPFISMFIAPDRIQKNRIVTVMKASIHQRILLRIQ